MANITNTEVPKINEINRNLFDWSTNDVPVVPESPESNDCSMGLAQ